MTGTDRSRAVPAGPAPAIILVEPQLGENIGFTARAMNNCGLTDLRLVRPRDGWPNDKALAAASGADAIINGARLFGSVEDAISDLNRVYASTARLRDMHRPVVTARQAAAELRAHIGAGDACGILFGPERMGLINDHVALADVAITIPLSPGFSSLNLGQSVMIIGYEWFQAGDETPSRQLPERSPPAARKDLIAMFEHLERELDASGFIIDPEKRPSMVRNLRTMFERAEMSEQEVRTMRGLIVSLVEGRRRPRRKTLKDNEKSEQGEEKGT